MIKDPESAYTPGRRGKSWLKLKRELATLDVVVTAVEYGHGKRIGVLSDYTFAVWDGNRLANIGKAYSGLTDAEIAEMTKWFLEHTHRRPRLPPDRRTQDCSGGCLQQHDALRPPRERLCAAIPENRALAAGQIAGRRRHDRKGAGDLREADKQHLAIAISIWQANLSRPNANVLMARMPTAASVAMPMLFSTHRNHASMRHFADHVFELNGGVVDMKFLLQPLFHFAQNRVR